MGQENLSGKEVFLGWCPHCWGSSHSFQPDVLGQGTGHSLRLCKGCFTTRAHALGTGLVGRAGTVPVATRDRWVPTPSGGSAPMSLSTCHIQLWDTRGVGTTQVQTQLPLDVQLWLTWPSISPCLAPHGHQTHGNMFSG